MLSYLCLGLLSLLLFQGSCFGQNKAINLSVAVSKELITAFNNQQDNIPCDSINFSHRYSNSFRGLANLIIICRSLKKSNIDATITLVLTSGYQRSIMMTHQGSADIAAETVWRNDINEQLFYFSDSVFDEQQFYKGIYTLEGHPLQNNSHEQLKLTSYTGITVIDWLYDLDKLDKLTDKITVASSYEGVYKILAAGKADFALLEFSSSDDLSILKDNIKLVPVQKVKVAIGNSRHFVIAKNKPNAQFLITAINKGLTMIKRSGELQTIYQQSGIQNAKVSAWPFLSEFYHH